MSISVMSAAATACETRDWRLTNLALQKLLYLAHMKFLGETGDPLIKENFEAWKYGPVVPRLYHEVKKFGDKPIGDIFFVDRNLSLPEHKMIKKVVLELADKTPGELVQLTHNPHGAWAAYYNPLIENLVIPNDAIKNEFKQNYIFR